MLFLSSPLFPFGSNSPDIFNCYLASLPPILAIIEGSASLYINLCVETVFTHCKWEPHSKVMSLQASW